MAARASSRWSRGTGRRVGCAAAGLAFLGAACVGCRSDDVPAGAPAPPAPAACEQPASDAGAVVARFGGRELTATELDAPLRLALYDLDHARWELRAGRLRALLAARVLGSRAAADGVSVDEWVRRRGGDADPAAALDAALREAGVEMMLAEPEPPALDVSPDDDPARGPAAAPVTVIEFLDYQSPFCARMQPVLHRLLSRYPTQVRLVVRDLPLPIHRDAARAAEAADCAGEQGGYWAYHDVLLQGQDDLQRSALERYATRTGIDRGRFAACLDDRRMRGEVEADAADAGRLGVTVVPTTFINGRYLKGPQAYEALAHRVELELVRLGIAPAPDATAPPPAAPATATTVAAPPMPAPQVPAPRRGGETSSAITLPRATVERALARRARLRQDLDRPRMDPGPGFEGHRLVRVRRTGPGTLYDAMGLRPGDVLIRLNGALVLDDAEPLFDALRDNRAVTLQVLRGGLPLTFEYAIE